MKSEVWAAWVQGIGSVLAILVAVAIARHQHGVQERERRRLELHEKHRAATLAELFWTRLATCLKTIHEGCQSGGGTGRQSIRRELPVLEDLALWPHSIEVTMLPIQAAVRVMALRAHCARARVAAEAAAAAASPKIMEEEFERLCEEVQQEGLQLTHALGELAFARRRSIPEGA